MHLFDGTTHPLCRGGRFVAYVALAAICLAGCSPALALNADEVVEQPAIPLPLADGEGQYDFNLSTLLFEVRFN